MHIETGGTEQKTKTTTPKSEESDGGEGQELVRRSQLEGGWGRLFKRGSTVSDPPKQKMVGTVIPSDCFTAIGQSEVLVAVAAGNHKVVGFWRDVGRGSATSGVTPLEVPVNCAAALGLDA